MLYSIIGTSSEIVQQRRAERAASQLLKRTFLLESSGLPEG